MGDDIFSAMPKPLRKPPSTDVLAILRAPGLRDCGILRLNFALEIVNDRAERFTLQMYDITLRQFWVLAAALEGKRSQLALADALGIDPNVMVLIIDGMERRGFVRRKRNPRDRREQLIKLTRKGASTVRGFISKKRKLYRDIFVGLTSGEIKALIEYAERLLAHA
jgi:DNA-binding MarR family transcriptional regulator